MSNITLIYPCCRDTKGATSVALTVPPLGLAYLAAVLIKAGHQVQIIDANLDGLSADKLADQISFNPDLVGFSVNILSFKEALKGADQIKKQWPAVPVVFGGPHASSLGTHILEKHAEVDGVVVGEGEHTLKEIVDSLGNPSPFEGVKGAIYRNGKDVVVNEPRPLIEDVDTIPSPAYHLLPALARYKTRSRAEPVGNVFTSRGCPSGCTFCYRSFGKIFRPHSPQRVVDEISFLIKEYGVKQIDIMDDNFTFKIDRAEAILDLIIERKIKVKINLQIGIRVDRVNPDLLKKMKKAGVFKTGFGVESADEKVLKDIKKGIKLSKAVALVKAARSLGIITHGYYIVGFPTDTLESVNKTIDFAVQLNSHYASFSICTPLPGTEIYKEMEEAGRLMEDVRQGIDEGLFSLKVFFKPKYLEPAQVKTLCESAWKRFYNRPSKMWDVLTTVRSKGEFVWLMRVLGDMVRTKFRRA